VKLASLSNMSYWKIRTSLFSRSVAMTRTIQLNRAVLEVNDLLIVLFL